MRFRQEAVVKLRLIVSVVAIAAAFAAPLAAQRAAKPPAPTPHWPDGRVNLGPEPGGKGHWNTGVGNLSEADVKMDGAFLVNRADLDKVAPFQPWAKALVQYRLDTLGKDDPHPRCIPPAGPRQFNTPVRPRDRRAAGTEARPHPLGWRFAQLAHRLHGWPSASDRRRSQSDLLRPLGRSLGRRDAGHRYRWIQRAVLDDAAADRDGAHRTAPSDRAHLAAGLQHAQVRSHDRRSRAPTRDRGRPAGTCRGRPRKSKNISVRTTTATCSTWSAGQPSKEDWRCVRSIFVVALSVASLAVAGRGAGRAPAEGFLDRHVGHQPESRRRRARGAEMGRQGAVRDDQPRHRRHPDQDRDAEPDGLDGPPRRRRQGQGRQADPYVIDGKIENLGLPHRSIVGTWKAGTENGPIRISRQ